MTEVTVEQLKRVIESQHGGTATFAQSLRLYPANAKRVDWDGIVHVFDLKDHPKAKRAYAWSASILGSAGGSRFFAVLHMGRITGPVEAVKAAAVAIRKSGAEAAQQ